MHPAEQQMQLLRDGHDKMRVHGAMLPDLVDYATAGRGWHSQ